MSFIEYSILVSILSLQVSSYIVMSSISNTGKKLNLPFNLPPSITSNEPGTWAYDTMSRRIITDIFERLLEDNEPELITPTSPLRSDCLLQLNDLKTSVQCGKTGYLRGIFDSGNDLQIWDQILSSIPEEQRNWLDAPWLITEFYFYRRIVEAFKYFETGYDMFEKQKALGLFGAVDVIEDVASRLPVIFDSAAKGDIEVALVFAIQTSLWGNKMDLSLWPAYPSEPEQGVSSRFMFGPALEAGKAFILDDHTNEVVKYLIDTMKNLPHSEREISIIVDNAGYELVSDMILAHILLQLKVATKVTFHTKAHPTFVSDATTQDCYQHVDFLSWSTKPSTSAMAQCFKEYVRDKKFNFVDDTYWCQPLPMWDMPSHIRDRLARSKLVFVKGDANYRRLLGDRHWPLDTNPKMIFSYWHVPVCPLRTFKAELGCGITLDQKTRAENQDKDWLVSGKWGVVQIGGAGFNSN